MANEIDNRIVGLGFDNTQFEAGVSKSLGTLGKLKDALAFKGASSGLDTVQKSIGNLSFDALTNGLNKVGSRFNALEQIAIGALRNIGAKIENLGSRLFNSLFINQARAGWAKYGEVTQSVQTIMAATGDSIDNVTGYVEKLNWFTDETSYSLTDMTNNISRFTSAGIGLDKATKQMQGIAAAAALAGQGAATASHAMSGFAKAMAAGYMSTINWNWIQTSKMDTLEFKQQLIEAAVAEKQLRKVGKGDNARYYTRGGLEVTAANMRETLSKKWLNTATMERALQVYGNFSDELGELYSLLGEGDVYITNDILKMIDQYTSKTLDLTKVSKLTGVSVEELDNRFKSLAGTENALGRKAFEAAQQAVTLRQASDALADAVSTGWMKTFTLIFGNYEEAKELWTELANTLYELFAEGGNRRNNILSEWHIADFGGYNTFKNALYDIMDVLTSLKELADKVFSTFFPSLTAEKLEDWTIKFREFAATLKESFGALSGYWEELHPTVEAAYTTVFKDEVMDMPDYSKEDLDTLYGYITSKQKKKNKYTYDYVNGLIHQFRNDDLDFAKLAKDTGLAAGDLEKQFMKFRNHTKDLSGKGIIQSNYEVPSKNPLKNLSDILEGLAKGVKFVGEAFKKLKEFVAPVVEPIKSLVGHLKDLGGAIGRRFGDIIDKLAEKMPNSSLFAFLRDDAPSVLVKIIDLIDRFVVSLTDLIDPDVDSDGMDFLENMFGFLKEIGGYLWDVVQAVLPVFSSVIEAISSVFKGLGEVLQSFFKDLNFETGTAKVKDIVDFIGSVLLVKLLGKLSGAGDKIDDLKKKFKDKGIFGTLFDWAIGNENEGGGKIKFLDTITEGFRSFADKIMGVVNKYTNISALKEFANSILKIAGSIFVLALLPVENFKRAMWGLIAIVSVLASLMTVINKISFSKRKTTALASMGAFFTGIGIAIAAFAASLAVLSFVKPERLIVPAILLLAGIVTIMSTLSMIDDTAKPSGILAAAAAITIVGFAFDEIAVAMLALALIPWGKLIKSALFLVGMLAIIAVVVDKLATTALIKGGPAAFIATAGAIAIIAFAMDLMAVSIMALAILPLDNLAAATVAIGVLTIALGVLLALGGEGNGVGMVLLASGMLILAPAILILAAALIALSLVPFGKMMGGVLGLVVALTALVFIGAIAEVAAVGLLALGASVVMIGVGAIGVGIAIGIAALAIAAAISIINGSIGGMIEKLGGAFSWIKEKIGIFKGDIEGAAEDTGRDITKGTAKGMKDHAKELENESTSIGEMFGNTFNGTALESADPEGLMTMISDTLGSDADKLGLTGYDIGNMFGSQLENGMLSYDFSGIMDQIKQSIINETGPTSSSAESAGGHIGGSIEKGAKKELLIRSPSRKFIQIMDYIGRAIGIGADNNEAYISSVGAGMGAALVSSTEDALSPLNDYNYNVSPSVSPVLDLSAVGGSAGLSFGATLTPSAVRSLGSVSADIRDQRESMNDYIDTAVQSAIEGMKDQLTFVVPLEVDGHQFAKSTAKFTRDAQNLLDRNTLRKGGYTS